VSEDRPDGSKPAQATKVEESGAAAADRPTPPPTRAFRLPPMEAPATVPTDPAAAQAFLQRAQLAEERLEQVLTSYRQLRTENEGFRDRTRRNIERQYAERRESLLLKFIDILDNFDRALEAAEGAYVTEPLVEGLILVRSQLLQTLQEEGLERVRCLGLAYDPAVAEAVEMRPIGDPDKHHLVLQELLRAYRIDGRVARAGRVVVGEYDPAAAAATAARGEQPAVVEESSLEAIVARVQASEPAPPPAHTTADGEEEIREEDLFPEEARAPDEEK